MCPACCPKVDIYHYVDLVRRDTGEKITHQPTCDREISLKKCIELPFPFKCYFMSYLMLFVVVVVVIVIIFKNVPTSHIAITPSNLIFVHSVQLEA